MSKVIKQRLILPSEQSKQNPPGFTNIDSIIPSYIYNTNNYELRAVLLIPIFIQPFIVHVNIQKTTYINVKGGSRSLISREKLCDYWPKSEHFNTKLPRDWLAVILNHLKHPVLLTDDRHQILYMNKSAQKKLKQHGSLTAMLDSCFHWKSKLGDCTLIECDDQMLAKRIIGENAEELFDRIFEGLHIVNEAGVTIFFNRTCEELDGIPSSDVIGRSIFEIYPELNEQSSTFFKTLRTKQEFLSYEYKYSSKKRKNIEVLSSTIPLFVDGRIVGAAEIVHDIKGNQSLSDNLSGISERIKKKRGKQSLQARYTFDDIIGENSRLKKTIELAKQAAKTDLPVFIYGETGTGKELFAQSIHNASPFCGGPFVAVNCAAIPDNLLESLLFGTVKGAFTGAENRIGLLEYAAGGSVFFDEIQALSPQMQAKLLRTLQEKTFQRVGDVEHIPLQAKIISATNIAPEKAIKENLLREDLYYRLCVFSITIPPLRERKDDLPLLIQHFLADFNRKTGKYFKDVHSDTIRLFQNYNWPGNVRELEHLLLTQTIINDPDEQGLLKIEIDSICHSIDSPTQPELPSLTKKTLPDTLLETERKIIMQTLQEHDYNITKASSALGITRQSLQYRMSKLGIKLEREAIDSTKVPS